MTKQIGTFTRHRIALNARLDLSHNCYFKSLVPLNVFLIEQKYFILSHLRVKMQRLWKNTAMLKMKIMS